MKKDELRAFGGHQSFFISGLTRYTRDAAGYLQSHPSDILHRRSVVRSSNERVMKLSNRSSFETSEGSPFPDVPERQKSDW